MTKTHRDLEARRVVVQTELDAAKEQAERNRMGQFATPIPLAIEILRYAREHLTEAETVNFIDPAFGTGSFYSALLDVFQDSHIGRALGYEVDPHYGLAAAALWSEVGLDIKLEDFTRVKPPDDIEKFNLLICNPPYVRHHHITSEEKHRLKARTYQASGIEINGLAGLYCYFLGLCHAWMAEGGLAGWLVPSEFMDVNYGASVKRYLLDKVTLLHIHRFDPKEVQFGDALVSSAVVWFSKRKPSSNYEVRMTYGGSLESPRLERNVPAETLRRDPKWTQYPMKDTHLESDMPMLSNFFRIRRGLASGSNKYFILSIDEIRARDLPTEAFRPILPSPRYVPDEIPADSAYNPVLERQLFLLDCKLPEDEIKKRYPTLWAYLEEGKSRGVADRYLCRHRSPWYAQEHLPPAPFLCTYLGRSDNKSNRPFRFILNHSQATAPNVYLMLYPNGVLDAAIRESPQLKRQVWEVLRGIRSKDILDKGRVYGGGLHKLEPKELGRVPTTALAELLAEKSVWQREENQLTLF